MTAHIVIINKSTVLTDAVVQAVIGAMQTQITRDFAPLWNAPASVSFGTAASPGAWPMYLFDNADQAGALGYHEDPHGHPDGKVFAKTTMDAGLSWTVTLSHELLELLGDPSADQALSHGTKRYAREACDPCEADQFGYEINGVKVSDFITLDWFGAAKRGAKYDFCSHLTKPRELIEGGYASVWSPRAGWQQIVCQSGVKQVRAGDLYSRPGTGGRTARRLAHGKRI